MQVADFSFDLPQHLIARYPTKERTDSRLLCLDGATGTLQHQQFTDLLNHLHAGDLLVLNDTRVIPARLFGTKITGGKLELLVERIISHDVFLAHVKSNRTPKIGSEFIVDDGIRIKVTGRQDALFMLSLCTPTKGGILGLLDKVGHTPLPPYMDRASQTLDDERYQTVYSKQQGAVAAPTAGLHFDEPLLDAVKAKGIQVATITLHVGAGTFLPVKVDTIQDHTMHKEWLSVDQQVVDAVNTTRANGKRVIAVGTTCVRALETASQTGCLIPYTGETDIFIYPGYEFKSVDAMITNFHLSQSTLLMLVSAFAGRDNILKAYHEAIAKVYRFFSYGDAMFITPYIDFTHANIIHPSTNEI